MSGGWDRRPFRVIGEDDDNEGPDERLDDDGSEGAMKYEGFQKRGFWCGIFVASGVFDVSTAFRNGVVWEAVLGMAVVFGALVALAGGAHRKDGT